MSRRRPPLQRRPEMGPPRRARKGGKWSCRQRAP